ncbi:MAG: Serine--tRNA ligase [Candidatus Magasanikbacteria bacterium]|nr:Serine--tRNA ligase [Candidatus Magasanikbacteria bacterium]
MLDIDFIRKNLETVKRNNSACGVVVDLHALVALDDERRGLIREIEDLRAMRNKKSKTKPTAPEIEKMRLVGDKIAEKEESLRNVESSWRRLMLELPNIKDKSVPVGLDEASNEVLRSWGAKPTFTFKPRPYFELAAVTPFIDTEKAAKVSGSRFFYLRGPLVRLERALIQFAFDELTQGGFEPILPPLMVKEEAMLGTGHFPASRNEIYAVNPGEDNLYLIGTGEVPLLSYHAGEALMAEELPKKYVTVTPCFRREAGSYGKDTSGILRVHQFYKVEMFVFCAPDQSVKLHEELLAAEEAIYQALGLHYQVVANSTGDSGRGAVKQYDIEAWFPSQNKYRELTSTSNTTDFQTRRVGIKIAGGELAHSLNGTGISDRAMLAVLEQFQNSDGGVTIPNVLRRYTGFSEIV